MIYTCTHVVKGNRPLCIAVNNEYKALLGHENIVVARYVAKFSLSLDVPQKNMYIIATDFLSVILHNYSSYVTSFISDSNNNTFVNSIYMVLHIHKLVVSCAKIMLVNDIIIQMINMCLTHYSPGTPCTRLSSISFYT